MSFLGDQICSKMAKNLKDVELQKPTNLEHDCEILFAIKSFWNSLKYYSFIFIGEFVFTTWHLNDFIIF